MNLTFVSVLMVVLVVASVFFKKLPTVFVLCAVPAFCGLLLGYNANELGQFAMGSIVSTMKASGIMCLFAMVYFTMLSETGMFNTMAMGLIKIIGGRVHLLVVMFMTSVIAAIGMLTATVATAHSIVFPAMLPLYKKMKLDRAHAMVIAQTSIAAMGFIPWGVAVVNSSAFAGVDPLSLSKRLIPVCICFIPVIVLQWFYFAWRHKKAGLPMVMEMSEALVQTDESENTYRRPKLFWVNLLIFAAVVFLLVTSAAPAYLVFILASFITILINYPEPKDHQKLMNKAGNRFFNTLMILIGISVFIGIFNETGMMEALAAFIVGVFPGILTRYIHLFLAAVMVIVIRFIPNKIYNSMYPALISIGSRFGLSGLDVIAPFVCNMSLATGSSPFMESTHIGVALLEMDIDSYCKKAVPVMEILNLIILATALAIGVIW